MRTVPADKITEAVKKLCLKANVELREDVLSALRAAAVREKGKARRCLDAIIENAAVARKEKLAICQDTGLPSVFVELGQEVYIRGGLSAAVQEGIREGYVSGNFRNSIVADPLKRGVSGFVPGVIHVDLVKGSKVRISLLAKGFGCENKSLLKMFNPTADEKDVVGFVVDAVRKAGADACPPYVVGVGIGGTADHACLLAKKSLLGDLRRKRAPLERKMLGGINALGIGPMGMGGGHTALSVAVERAPTHIAGLPVAVSISCHALRSAGAVI